MEVYLDNSATTKVCKEAAEAAYDVMTENYGNPSSVHSAGVRAKKVLEESRKNIAEKLSVNSEEIYFSHSGTLANNTAIFGAVKAGRKKGNRIITTALEHPSVARCMDKLEDEGFEVIRLKPSSNATFAPEELIETVNKDTILISTMFVNNEVGAINPVEYIKKAVKAAGAPALIHVDAIQAFGKLPVKPAKLGVDMLTISGHKVHAPKGVGALYIKKGVNIKPYVLGGGQENNMFSGTEPLPAIAGFGAAVKVMPDPKNIYNHTAEIRDYALSLLSDIEDVTINSHKDALPNIINMSVRGIPSQVLINFLAEREIFVSAGSACTKGHRSEVLTALGLPPEIIDSAIRVSLSRFTTKEEIKIFASAVKEAAATIRTKL